MLSSLCMDMCSSYDYLFQLVPSSQSSTGGDERAFMKSVKVLGFQMKVLLMLVKEFEGYLDTSVRDLYKLILHFQKNVPPSLKSIDVPGRFTEEVQRQVTAALEPLIGHLLSNSDFMTCVSAQHQELDPEVHLPWCLTAVTIVDLLPSCPDEVQFAWICPKVYPEDVPRHGIVNTIFEATKHCYVELTTPVYLPGVMCKGKPQRNVSLYEHICTRLCAFVASHPAQHFSTLEESLLKYVVGRDSHCALLAIDVWSFLARYGTADLCRDHCHFLASLLGRVPLNSSPQCCHLVVLLRRMLHFLAQEHQEEFVKTFPFCDNMGLWRVLPLGVFTPSLAQSIVEQLVPVCSKTMHNWLNSSNKTSQSTVDLEQSLHCLCNIYQIPNLVENHIPEPQQCLLVDKSLSLWDFMTADAVTAYPILGNVMCRLLTLNAYHLPVLTGKQIWKVLSCSSRVLTRSIKDSIKMAVHTFLSSLGKKTLPPSFEQTQILRELPQVFASLLSDSNYIVHQRALEGFAQFAEETSHESVVTDSLQTDPKLQETVVSFLNQMANGVQGPAPADCLSDQKEAVKAFHSASSQELYPAATWQDRNTLNAESQPAAKKPRTGIGQTAAATSDPRETEFGKVLPQLHESIANLTILRKNGPFPAWLVQDLQTVQLQLTELL